MHYTAQQWKIIKKIWKFELCAAITDIFAMYYFSCFFLNYNWNTGNHPFFGPSEMMLSLEITKYRNTQHHLGQLLKTVFVVYPLGTCTCIVFDVTCFPVFVGASEVISSILSKRLWTWHKFCYNIHAFWQVTDLLNKKVLNCVKGHNLRKCLYIVSRHGTVCKKSSSYLIL